MINSRIKPQPWVYGRMSLIDSSYISITVWTIGEKSRGILENSWVIFSIRVGSSWRINLNDDSLLLSDPENNCCLHCDLFILQKNFSVLLKISLSFAWDILDFLKDPIYESIFDLFWTCMRENIVERWLAARLETARGSLANASTMTHFCLALIGWKWYSESQIKKMTQRDSN